MKGRVQNPGALVSEFPHGFKTLPGSVLFHFPFWKQTLFHLYSLQIYKFVWFATDLCGGVSLAHHLVKLAGKMETFPTCFNTFHWLIWHFDKIKIFLAFSGQELDENFDVHIFVWQIWSYCLELVSLASCITSISTARYLTCYVSLV